MIRMCPNGVRLVSFHKERRTNGPADKGELPEKMKAEISVIEKPRSTSDRQQTTRSRRGAWDTLSFRALRREQNPAGILTLGFQPPEL